MPDSQAINKLDMTESDPKDTKNTTTISGWTFVGKTKIEDVKQPFRQHVLECVKMTYNENPLAVQVMIRGGEPHVSTKDLANKKEIISVRFSKEDGSRVGTVHVHEDGSVKTKKG